MLGSPCVAHVAYVGASAGTRCVQPCTGATFQLGTAVTDHGGDELRTGGLEDFGRVEEFGRVQEGLHGDAPRGVGDHGDGWHWA